jgi:hypothetical protein
LYAAKSKWTPAAPAGRHTRSRSSDATLPSTLGIGPAAKGVKAAAAVAAGGGGGGGGVGGAVGSSDVGAGSATLAAAGPLLPRLWLVGDSPPRRLTAGVA